MQILLFSIVGLALFYPILFRARVHTLKPRKTNSTNYYEIVLIKQ